MPSNKPSHPIKTGAVGGTPIVAELKDGWAIVTVLLSANYDRVHPAGFPTLPPCGGEASKVFTTGTLQSGVTRKFFQHEANALVAAGAGTIV